jgi:hypothetical protein
MTLNATRPRRWLMLLAYALCTVELTAAFVAAAARPAPLPTAGDMLELPSPLVSFSAHYTAGTATALVVPTEQRVWPFRVPSSEHEQLPYMARKASRPER